MAECALKLLCRALLNLGGIAIVTIGPEKSAEVIALSVFSPKSTKVHREGGFRRALRLVL
jgi:hypothetical protein